MKKKYVRFAALAFASALSLCACGKKDADAESSGMFENLGGDSENSETVGSTESEAGNSGSNTSDAIVTIVEHPLTCQIDGKERATGVYPEIVLSDEYAAAHQELALSVEDFNSGWRKETESSVSEYANWAAEDTFYEDPVYCSETRLSIARLDDKLFTIIPSFYYDSGGAHPNHGSSSINFDPATGNWIKLSEVLDNADLLPDGIRTELTKAYPDYEGLLEEIDSFYFRGDEDDPDQFKQKLKDDTYSWNIDEKGLTIFFSPYEIASYATGYLEVTLSPQDYPDLIKKEYMLDAAQDLEAIVKTATADTESVEPADPDAYEEAPFAEIENPTWKRYQADALQAGTDHIKLTKTKEEKTDWLDTEAWCAKNGFQIADLNHDDGTYQYSGYYTRDFDYMYQCLEIYDSSTYALLNRIDLERLCNGPDDEEEKYSGSTQFIRYATIVDDVLYAEIGHMGYATEEPMSSYIVAIDLVGFKLLFRSEPLVANAYNFQIVGDTIVCGYGFTAEPDYIYLLDRFTGEKYETIPVNSGPSQFEVVGDTLYVATYNTAYEFAISH